MPSNWLTKLTATLREQLKNLNLEVTASEGKVTFQHDRLVLIEIQDSAQSNHLLALATPGGRADGAKRALRR